MSTEDFETALSRWLEAAQTLRLSVRPTGALSTMIGTRYVRIVEQDESSRSAFCFIDRTNGDVLKAASWKAPAKHARGNIFAAEPTRGLTPYGAAYLR